MPVPELSGCGTSAVSAGGAQLVLPIPAAAVGGEVWFQWVEVRSPITAPILLSDGGGVVVHP